MRHDVRKRPKPEWIKAGITMVSMQEPLAFLRRAGMVGVDPHDDHFARYSEEGPRPSRHWPDVRSVTTGLGLAASLP